MTKLEFGNERCKTIKRSWAAMAMLFYPKAVYVCLGAWWVWQVWLWLYDEGSAVSQAQTALHLATVAVSLMAASFSAHLESFYEKDLTGAWGCFTGYKEPGKSGLP